MLVGLLAGMFYLIWSINNVPNIPVSPRDIGSIQTTREILRRDAAQARKDLNADEDDETFLWKLIRKRQSDPYFPLTKENRLMIHKYWGMITEGLTPREISRMMAILDMRYDDAGNVVDIPLKERTEAQKEARMREGIEADTSAAMDAFLNSARANEAIKYEAGVDRDNAAKEKRTKKRQADKDVKEMLGGEDLSSFLLPESSVDPLNQQPTEDAEDLEGEEEGEGEEDDSPAARRRAQKRLQEEYPTSETLFNEPTSEEKLLNGM